MSYTRDRDNEFNAAMETLVERLSEIAGTVGRTNPVPPPVQPSYSYVDPGPGVRPNVGADQARAHVVDNLDQTIRHLTESLTRLQAGLDAVVASVTVEDVSRRTRPRVSMPSGTRSRRRSASGGGELEQDPADWRPPGWTPEDDYIRGVSARLGQMPPDAARAWMEGRYFRDRFHRPMAPGGQDWDTVQRLFSDQWARFRGDDAGGIGWGGPPRPPGGFAALPPGEYPLARWNEGALAKRWRYRRLSQDNDDVIDADFTVSRPLNMGNWKDAGVKPDAWVTFKNLFTENIRGIGQAIKGVFDDTVVPHFRTLAKAFVVTEAARAAPGMAGDVSRAALSGDMFGSWGAGILENNARYSRYSPDSAVAMAQLNVNNVMRDIRIGDMIKSSTVALARAQDAYNESAVPFESFYRNVANSFGVFTSGVGRGINEALSPVYNIGNAIFGSNWTQEFLSQAGRVAGYAGVGAGIGAVALGWIPVIGPGLGAGIGGFAGAGVGMAQNFWDWLTGKETLQDVQKKAGPITDFLRDGAQPGRLVPEPRMIRE